MDKDFIKLFENLTPKEQKMIVDLIVLILGKNDEILELRKYIRDKL